MFHIVATNTPNIYMDNVFHTLGIYMTRLGVNCHD